MVDLNYEARTDKPSGWAAARRVLLRLPAGVMVLMGVPCCLLIPFANDSPQTKMGPVFWIVIWMMGAMAPVGIGTGLLSELLAKVRGPRWLWLNLVVAVVYIGTAWILSKHVND